MPSVTINPYVFQRQEDSLMHLAGSLEAISDRVLNLMDLVKACSEDVQTQMETETGELHSILHCLSVVADAAGSKVAGWRAWADKEGISITSQLG